MFIYHGVINYQQKKPFTYDIYFYILLFSILSIIIPVIATIIQLYREATNNWSNNRYNGSSIRAWLTEHSKVMYLLSIITGSGFTAIELCNVCHIYNILIINK